MNNVLSNIYIYIYIKRGDFLAPGRFLPHMAAAFGPIHSNCSRREEDTLSRSVDRWVPQSPSKKSDIPRLPYLTGPSRTLCAAALHYSLAHYRRRLTWPRSSPPPPSPSSSPHLAPLSSTPSVLPHFGWACSTARVPLDLASHPPLPHRYRRSPPPFFHFSLPSPLPSGFSY